MRDSCVRDRDSYVCQRKARQLCVRQPCARQSCVRQLCAGWLRVRQFCVCSTQSCVCIHETGVCLWTGCSGKDLFAQSYRPAMFSVLCCCLPLSQLSVSFV